MVDKNPVKKLLFEPVSRPGTLKLLPSLSQCQIITPMNLVSYVWEIVYKYRDYVESVIDLGAGDGRFSKAGRFDKYVGYEIDSSKNNYFSYSNKIEMINRCVLNSFGSYDISIGNPPFIRHQDLSDQWKAKAVKLIQNELGVSIGLLGNLYQYFMWLSLIRTKPNGLVALVIPLEWIHRTSAKILREYINENKWDVYVYRLPHKIFFNGIAAVPSITVIDKSKKSGLFKLFEVSKDLTYKEMDKSIIDLSKQFEYLKMKGKIYAKRGFSTGSQDFFVLNEKERISSQISISEVVPCITTMKPLQTDTQVFDEYTFQKLYVERDMKCWLLKTDNEHLSEKVKDYLNSVPQGIQKNTTCSARDPWYSYRLPASPDILYSSSFKNGKKPKMAVNEVNAKNISAVHGIFIPSSWPSARLLVSELSSIDYTVGTIPSLNNLRKIEVRQMDGIINVVTTRLSEEGVENKQLQK